MKAFILVLLAISTSSALDAQNDCTANNRGVFFGERSRELTDTPGPNVIRIFMDKKGLYYPDIFIPDHDMLNDCSSLDSWYSQNPNKLSSICKRYHISDSSSTTTKIAHLNSAIIQSYIDSINATTKNYDFVNILLHGFRKKVYGNIDRSATYSDDDNALLRKKLDSSNSRKILFIEIYWDSKFITPAQSYRFKGFKLFENAAIPNANNVGLSLRPLVSGINHPVVNIITHSLGARVAGELLFNASGGTLHNESSIGTPSQPTIRLCMIAPAIGHDYFSNYYLRNTTYNYREKDNYSVAVVYNENDFVLLKQYGWGVNASATEYGNTSLGCNHQGDVQKLVGLFSRNFSSSAPPVILNFSLNNSEVEMGCHLVSCYVGHRHFIDVINYLYGQ